MSKKLKSFLSIILVLATMCSVSLIATAGSTETKDAVIGGGIIYLTGTLGVSNTGNTRHIYMKSTSNTPYQEISAIAYPAVGSYQKPPIHAIIEYNTMIMEDTKDLVSDSTIIVRSSHFFTSYNYTTFLEDCTPSRTMPLAAG